MTNKYGGRWKKLRTLAQGGQGQVYEVEDETKAAGEGTFALKRVQNPKRHARFRAEIEAVKRLDHPNVIKLIDHSALDETDTAPEDQYLVMPLARGGDLSKRVSLYRGSLDTALKVALQIAAALRDAHTSKIIHRDIKPENILFPDANNHDVWVTDFGICLLRDAQRATEQDEIVGPWAFMAPELEYGGQLQVDPSVDIYSLGKLIYYMVSGGRVVPREEISHPKYAEVFAPGGRYDLLNVLLRRMVCTIETRMRTMDEVISELGRIVSWDERSALTPNTPAARARLAAIARAGIHSREVAAQNNANQNEQRAAETAVQLQILDWLENELEKLKAESEVGAIECAVRRIPAPDPPMLTPSFAARIGLELALSNVGTNPNAQHAFQLYFCYEFRVQYFNSPTNTVRPLEDRVAGIVPAYQYRAPGEVTFNRKQTPVVWLFAASGGFTTTRAPMPAGVPKPPSEKTTIKQEFHFSQWPAIDNDMRAFVGTCWGRFLEAVDRNQDGFKIGLWS